MDTQRTDRRGQQPLALAALCLLFACGERTEVPAPANTPLSQPATAGTPAPQRARMHPSWDLDGDGVNDCERDGSCDHTQDYTRPRDTKPGFSCAGALTAVQQTLCSEPRLGLLDQQMAQLLNALQMRPNVPETLRAEQQQWLTTRDQCVGSDDLASCLESAYRARLTILRQYRQAEH